MLRKSIVQAEKYTPFHAWKIIIIIIILSNICSITRKGYLSPFKQFSGIFFGIPVSYSELLDGSFSISIHTTTCLVFISLLLQQL